jgi:hypothetical protein
LEIFKLNVFLYPNSANVYDSVAEAYAINGNRELAVRITNAHSNSTRKTPTLLSNSRSSILNEVHTIGLFPTAQEEI